MRRPKPVTAIQVRPLLASRWGQGWGVRWWRRVKIYGVMSNLGFHVIEVCPIYPRPTDETRFVHFRLNSLRERTA